MADNKVNNFPNKRVCAFLLDLTLVQIITLPFSAAIAFIVYGIYFMIRDALFNGKSIGKLIVGIKVVDLEGGKATLQKSFLRNVIFLIPLVSYIIEYIAMTSSKEGRRLGDLFAKTKIEDEKPNIGDGRFLLFSILIVIVVAIIKITYALSLVAKLKSV